MVWDCSLCFLYIPRTKTFDDGSDQGTVLGADGLDSGLQPHSGCWNGALFRAATDCINIEILQTMVSGIPLVSALRTRT